MKAKTIFRGALAGLMSMSLLMSGMPVLAVGVDGAAASQQAEQPQDPGAEQQTPKEQPQDPGAEQQTPKEQPSEQPQDPGAGQQPSEQPQDPGAGQQPSEQPQDPGAGQQPSEQPQDPGAGQQPSEQPQDPGAGQQPSEQPQDPGAGQQPSEQPQDPGQQLENPDTGEQPPEQPQIPDRNEESEEDKDTEKDEEESAKDKDSKKDEKNETEKENEEDVQALAAVVHPAVNGNIAIDGDLADWKEVAGRKSNAGNVDSWKAAVSADGGILYLSFTGSASTEWDYNFTGNKFEIAYADGTAGEDSALSVSGGNGGAVVKNAWYGDVSGASAAIVNDAHGNNAGPYSVEFAVPMNFFHSQEFTLTFGGTSVAFADIQQINGKAAAPEAPAVYAGIAIDGSYGDWAAVAKADVSCPNSQHPGCLSQAAAVYDGDWFYIYLKDGEGSNASGAGTHSNGKFAIVSDLGYETDIQLSTAPEVKGVNGAQVAYVGSEWEIAIPKDQLPKYKESLSFNFYLGEALVGNIVNLKPDSGNNLDHLFEGINFDGEYGDWEDYGHSTIEYATAGSQESQIDAKGALYASGEKMFGHVVTNMPQHLQEAGGEFTSAVTIVFNQSQESLQNGTYDPKMAFYPRCVAVDASGNIDWNPKLSGLAEGTYEYYLASTDAWHTSNNINNLNEMDQLYGKMIITVGKDGKDEMEFYLDLPMIAKKLGVDETDLKQIAAQFGRIGQQWIFTAGTSTGPAAGVILCVASVTAVFWYRKRKYGELLPAGA